MKNKMKSALAVASLLIGASQTSHAALLVGWHSFAGTADQAPNEVAVGYSGLLAKAGVVSGNIGGSNDGFYGNSTIVVPGGAASHNDGLQRINPAQPLTVSVTNTGAQRTDLQALYFDAVRAVAGAAALTVNYQIGAGPVQTLTGTPFNVEPQGGPGGTSELYTSYGLDLSGLYLHNGKTATFWFNTTNPVRIDNIAIAGIVTIPEPGSLLAIGCLLGSGLLLRSRKARPAIA